MQGNQFTQITAACIYQKRDTAPDRSNGSEISVVEFGKPLSIRNGDGPGLPTLTETTRNCIVADAQRDISTALIIIAVQWPVLDHVLVFLAIVNIWIRQTLHSQAGSLFVL